MRRAGRGGPLGRRGAVLLLVLVITGVIFTVGLAAIDSATSDTQAGRGFAAYTVALHAAQSGFEVAKRRIYHPWDTGGSFGLDWGGTGGYVALPSSADGLGALMDAYYLVTVRPSGTNYLVTCEGRAMAVGASIDAAGSVLATRSVSAVIQEPTIELPYTLLSAQSAYLPQRLTVYGDVYSSANATVAAGAYVAGSLLAVGNIVTGGAVIGGALPATSERVSMPPVHYYLYRPTYSYGGQQHTAVELAGTQIDGQGRSLPTGMVGNPNNVFYTNVENFVVKSNINATGVTIVAMYDLTIQGDVRIAATAGFPALIVNGNLNLDRNCQLTTEGLVVVRGTIRQVLTTGGGGSGGGGGGGNSGQGQGHAYGHDQGHGNPHGGQGGGDGSGAIVEDTSNSPPYGVWNHRGPVILQGNGNFSTYCGSRITLSYDITRTTLQPLDYMVLPAKVISYSEN